MIPLKQHCKFRELQNAGQHCCVEQEILVQLGTEEGELPAGSAALQVEAEAEQNPEAVKLEAVSMCIFDWIWESCFVQREKNLKGTKGWVKNTKEDLGIAQQMCD